MGCRLRIGKRQKFLWNRNETLVAASQKQKSNPTQARRAGEGKPRTVRRPAKAGGMAAEVVATLWTRGILVRAAIGVVVLAAGILAYDRAKPPAPTQVADAHKAPPPLPPPAPPRPVATRSVAAAEDSAPPAHDKAPAPPRKMAALTETTAPDRWFMEAYLRCWTPPSNVPRTADYAAKIRVVHDASGSLAANPVLVNPPSDPEWRPYAESALQAVKKCNPLTVPSEYLPRFDEWRKMTLYFQPAAAQE
jgi:hypothetical protein